MCRTSVLEITKIEEVKPLIDLGLVKDRSEYEEMVRDAKAIMSHYCDQRFQRRINHTGGILKDFICRKPYLLRESPDNLAHSYVPLPVTLPPICGEILERIGLVSSDGDKVVFNNAHF